MPCRYQPESLLNLSEARVVSDMVRTCYQLYELTHRTCLITEPQAFAYAKNRIRPFWNASVPPPIRRRLLSKCMDMMENAFHVDYILLYLLVIMLDEDIRELKIKLCCYYGCSHQTTLMQLLTAQAKGLTSLDLVRPTLFRLGTCKQFKSINLENYDIHFYSILCFLNCIIISPMMLDFRMII